VMVVREAASREPTRETRMAEQELGGVCSVQYTEIT
jgi:hypothetical protein